MRPSAQSLQKPQVFMKVEFGVSWTGQHPPRRRGFEYKSRALRERNPDFPRHVPAPTTNYLASTTAQRTQMYNEQIPQLYFQHPPQQSQEHRSCTDQQPDWPRESQPPPQQQQHHYSTHHLMPEPHEPARGRARHIEAIPSLGLFPGRESTPGTGGERHERGSSAPPPLSDNHWDVVQQENIEFSNQDPAAQDHQHSFNVWKDLPEVPTRFRLGEDGMPWDGAWTFPMGYEPYLEPDPYLRSSESVSSSSPKPCPARPCQERSSRTLLEHSGPLPPPPPPDFLQSPILQARGEADPAQRRNLEALGSAMMTVDNGFENQWWNQDERGERRQLAAVHPPPATERQVEEQMALGWVGALLPSTAPGGIGGGGETCTSRRMSLVGGGRGNHHHHDSLISPESTYVGAGSRSYTGNNNNNMIVSPVSTFSGPVSNLSRSLSTRSDELYFGGRWA